MLEPHGDNSPVAKFLAKGGGLYHLCFEIDNLDEHLETLQQQGAFIIKPPTPATAFQGRRVAFVLMPDKDLVEFIET